MKLWLVRHARPLVAPGLCYGASDVAADPQATAAAARALARVLPPGLPVHCSPLQRCTALASALHALRPDLDWRADPRLAEMDFGRWEGTPWDAIAACEFADWMADFPGYPAGGSESVRAFMARVGAAHAEALARASEAVWITHAGVARAVQLLRQGFEPRSAADWPREGPGPAQWQCFG